MITVWYIYLYILPFLKQDKKDFFVIRAVMKKQLEKNPPINEKMIEAMMSSMGRKPSQKQVKQVMQQMNRFK